jgi:hypothetical protein
VVAPTGATAVERGVFAEIAIDRRATAQGTGILLAAALIGGWRFLWPGDSEWHVQSWLVEEGGVALASSAAAAVLLWRLARFGGGRGTVLGLWQAIAFALAHRAGCLRVRGLPRRGRPRGPLDRPRRRGDAARSYRAMAIAAVAVPVLLYVGFFAFVVLVLGWD